jgi:hypothetical protein
MIVGEAQRDPMERLTQDDVGDDIPLVSFLREVIAPQVQELALYVHFHTKT